MDVSCKPEERPRRWRSVRASSTGRRARNSGRRTPNESRALTAEAWPRQNGGCPFWCCSPRWVRASATCSSMCLCVSPCLRLCVAHASAPSEMYNVLISYYCYRVLCPATTAFPGRDDDCRHHSNIWRRQRRTAVGGGGGWRDLDYGNLTNAIRDIVEAMTTDCTLAVHSGVDSTH